MSEDARRFGLRGRSGVLKMDQKQAKNGAESGQKMEQEKRANRAYMPQKGQKRGKEMDQKATSQASKKITCNTRSTNRQFVAESTSKCPKIWSSGEIWREMGYKTLPLFGQKSDQKGVG